MSETWTFWDAVWAYGFLGFFGFLFLAFIFAALGDRHD